MATKKKAPSRKSTRPQAKSKGKLTLELVTENQRAINGSVYEALDLILDIIKASVPGADRQKLQRAESIIEAIPGYDPPGCGPGPYP